LNGHIRRRQVSSLFFFPHKKEEKRRNLTSSYMAIQVQMDSLGLQDGLGDGWKDAVRTNNQILFAETQKKSQYNKQKGKLKKQQFISHRDEYGKDDKN